MQKTSRLLVASVDYTASLSLIFDGLNDEIRDCLDIVHPGDPTIDLCKKIKQSRAVMISRSLHLQHLQNLARYCFSIGHPYFYYTDDNFWILARETPKLMWFLTPMCQEIVRHAKGVVVTSDSLEDFFKNNDLNQNILRFKPIIDKKLLAPQPPRNEEYTIAFIGSAARASGFQNLVCPAISKISRKSKIILREQNNLSYYGSHQNLKFDIDFSKFIRRWRNLTPDVLVHPPAITLNSSFKTANAILIAFLLGAVPIVGNEKAYEGLSTDQGVYVSATPDAWKESLDELSNPDLRQRAYDKLKNYCMTAFDSKLNEETIKAIMDG